MPEAPGWHEVKYEADLDPLFASEIASIPDGEKLYSCIQCGTCSAACPISPYMESTPRKIVAMIRAGFRREVLSSNTPWLCASCYACTVECPRGIKITDVLYACKRLGIREGVYPKKFLTSVLAEEFFKIVKKNGRNHEGSLLMKMYMRTNPFQIFKQMGLGMKLFFKGRMNVLPDAIDRKDEFQSLLQALSKETMIKRREELAAHRKEGE
jgi:quinone-modifying oxidoreductase subunit QmoC